jgi:hypothetical protein
LERFNQSANVFLFVPCGYNYDCFHGFKMRLKGVLLGPHLQAIYRPLF